MEYFIGAGEHDQLIRVLDDDIAFLDVALDRIEDQAAWHDDEDRSDLGDDYDRKYEQREDLRELRDLIVQGRDERGGAVDVDEWQRSAIDQAREIIRQESTPAEQLQPAEIAEQLQPAERPGEALRMASFPEPTAPQLGSAADPAGRTHHDAGRLRYAPPSGLRASGFER